MPQATPARAEALVREWPHLGFVSSRDELGEPFLCGGIACCVEIERSPYLGSMAEYFHRLVNIETNRDFAPKALELALAGLRDAKFAADSEIRALRLYARRHSSSAWNGSMPISSMR